MRRTHRFRIVRRRPRGPVLVMLAAMAMVVALAGCARPGSAGGRPTDGEGSGGSTAPQQLSETLTGRTFLSTGLDGRDLAPGSTIRIEFGDNGSISANAGCNRMGGTARWDGAALTVPELIQTEMACDAPLMAQEQWFADLLVGGVTVALTGNQLSLTRGSVTLDLLDRTVADPDRPLVGTTWILDGITSGTGDSASASWSERWPSVVLRIGDRQLDVFNGLTWLAAEITDAGGNPAASSGTVHVAGGLGGDGIGCDGGGADCFVDVSVLGSDFDYAITAGSLTVSGIGSTAGHGLTFKAAAEAFAGPDLIGHSFRLARLFTDAGGADTKYDDARFTIRFDTVSATAESTCGTLTYPQVRYRAETTGSTVDLGEPTGPACDLGSDPSGVPSGSLMVGVGPNGEYYLSTGFVAWYFHPEK